MAIKYSFVDGVVYGTDDINKITNDLVGAGISPFPDAETYNVSDINVLTEALVGEGVQLGGCLCTVSNMGTENMSVFVSKGTVFFENGVKLEIDDEGYEIRIGANNPGYVFANFNSALQVADVLFQPEVSSIGESVLLAYIAADGTVTDMREFAEAKVATMGKNIMKKYAFQRVYEKTVFDGKYIVAKIPNVNVNRFCFAILATSRSFVETGEYVYFPEVAYNMSFFEIAAQKNHFTLCASGESQVVNEVEHLYKSAVGNYSYYPGIVGGELCLLCNCNEREVDSAINLSLNCTACLI